TSPTMAVRIACFRVRAREPSEAPMALETSLAPTPQAMKNPKAQARMSSRCPCSTMTCMAGIPCAGSAGDQDLQAAAYLLGVVGQVSDPVDDLVEEDDVDGGQFILDGEELGAYLHLQGVVVVLQPVQVADECLGEVDVAAAEARFQQVG